MKRQITCWLFFLSTLVAFADESHSLKGRFELKPTLIHTSPITGVMTLTFDGDKVSAVQIGLDQPIHGSSDYRSNEQWSVQTLTNSANMQLGLAYKLEGPSHKWYFVWVGNSTDSKVSYSGNIYKVKEALADIQKKLTDGVSSDPADWKRVGAATLSTGGD